MSFFESKIEEYQFGSKGLSHDLNLRTETVGSIEEELDKRLPDSPRLKEYYRALKKQYDENSPHLVHETCALVCLACRRLAGKKWTVCGQEYEWRLIPRDVQIKAGIILCDEFEENRFARIRTGEGKTLTGLFPAAYHAHFGKVHVMTANDYLARRDWETLAPVLEYLGIGSAFLSNDTQKKHAAYSADVLYGSDKEFAFDFLRDSIRPPEEGRLCGARDFIIVDEADHIMLDELRTPVILSAETEDDNPFITTADELVRNLIRLQRNEAAGMWKTIQKGPEQVEDKRDYLKLIVRLKHSGVAGKLIKRLFKKDPGLEKRADRFERTYLLEKGFRDHVESGLYFVVRKEEKSSFFTEKGITKIEEQNPVDPNLFTVPDYAELRRSVEKTDGKYQRLKRLKELSDREYFQNLLIHALHNALHAYMILQEGKDYIRSEEGRIELVTLSTGRADPVKRYQRGLTQAIECKENVTVSKPDIAVTATHLPALFQAYRRISALSGTIAPNRKEIKKLYGLHTWDIPTFRPPAAGHFPVRLFKSEKEKLTALRNEVTANNRIGRPVLIGTPSVRASEKIAAELRHAALNVRVLNAKTETEEPGIIARAGELGAITISTNMAGRGVDIAVLAETDREVARRFVNRQDFLLKDNPSVIIRTFSKYEADLILKVLAEEYSNDAEFRKTAAKKRYQVIISQKGEEKQGSEPLQFHAGLHVIGFELEESERISIQLRGRTGRQGAPGSSVYYASPDDEVCSRFPSTLAVYNRLSGIIPGGIQNFFDKVFVKIIQYRSERQAEDERLENRFFGAVTEFQRNAVLQFREAVLNRDTDMSDLTGQFITAVVSRYVSGHFTDKVINEDQLTAYCGDIEETFNTDMSYLGDSYPELLNDIGRKKTITEITLKHLLDLNDKRSKSFCKTKYHNILRKLIVETLDRQWVSQINELEYLKDSARLMIYAGKDTREAFVRLAQRTYAEFQRNVATGYLKRLFHYEIPHQIKGRPGMKGISDAVRELL